jgi:hypothetical protein
VEYVDSHVTELAEGEELFISCEYHEMLKKWIRDYTPYDVPGWRFIGLDPTAGLVYAVDPSVVPGFHKGIPS